jgi:chorismate mutase/prephenate dehydratase
MLDSLQEIRRRIDEVDKQLVELLNERVKLALRIKDLKSQLNVPVYAPHREREVLERIIRLNSGPFPNRALETVYREIISATRALERPLRIAFLGPIGSYGHEASLRHFGSSAEYLPIRSQSEIFREVEVSRADYGIVAIENSIRGSVAETLDAFLTTELRICAEVYMPIHHHLLSKATELKEIRRVYSHPQALAQCREWLDTHMKDVARIPVASTSEGAAMAAKEGDAAAIASRLAAEIHDLNLLAEHIEDHLGNATRFLVIGHHHAERTGEDKTSFIFSVKHRAGALMHALEKFSKYNLNLTKLESRPYPGRRWEYVFFADVEGHIDEEPMRRAAEDLKDACLMVKFLGSYPKAKEA